MGLMERVHRIGALLVVMFLLMPSVVEAQDVTSATPVIEASEEVSEPSVDPIEDSSEETVTSNISTPETGTPSSRASIGILAVITPEAPVFNDPSGPNDSITLPAPVGYRWQVTRTDSNGVTSTNTYSFGITTSISYSGSPRAVYVDAQVVAVPNAGNSFPEGTQSTWDYRFQAGYTLYCRYDGPSNYAVAIQGPSTALYVEDFTIPGVHPWPATQESRDYCNNPANQPDGPEAYAWTSEWYSTSTREAFICKAGAEGTSSGFPDGYGLLIRWDLNRPTESSVIVPANEPYSVPAPAGAVTVSIRPIRPDGSLATRLYDTSPQKVCFAQQLTFSPPAVTPVCQADNDEILLAELPAEGVDLVSDSGWTANTRVITYDLWPGYGYDISSMPNATYDSTTGLLTFTLTDSAEPCPVTPVAPTSEAVCGPNNDSITVPDQPEGVSSTESGWNDNTYTVTFTASEGYVIEGQTEYIFLDESTLCPATPTVVPTETPVTPEPTVVPTETPVTPEPTVVPTETPVTPDPTVVPTETPVTPDPPMATPVVPSDPPTTDTEVITSLPSTGDGQMSSGWGSMVALTVAGSGLLIACGVVWIRQRSVTD